jgi:hypothetical protein
MAAAAGAATSGALAAGASGRGAVTESACPPETAAIGGSPEGFAAFPQLSGPDRRRPEVRGIVRVGDIKDGSRSCSHARFAIINGCVDQFADPGI